MTETLKSITQHGRLERGERIVTSRRFGYSWDAIAVEIGRSRSTVIRMAKEYLAHAAQQSLETNSDGLRRIGTVWNENQPPFELRDK